MSREDLERELKAIKSKIENKISDKLKSLGLLETYNDAIKKSDSWDEAPTFKPGNFPLLILYYQRLSLN